MSRYIGSTFEILPTQRDIPHGKDISKILYSRDIAILIHTSSRNV